MANQSPLKIAILINTPPGNEFRHDVRNSYTEIFRIMAPKAHLRFFDPVFANEFPDPKMNPYDFLVLSGGKADASSEEPWVLGVLHFVRRTVCETTKTKLLGICWGHQAIARALGGEVQPVPTGPIAAVQDIRLTYAGRKFFGYAAEAGYYTAPEFHIREAAKPAPGFIHLAENHECFLNATGTVLTFQAHPEVQSGLARKMLLEEDDVYNGNSTKEQLEEELRKLMQPTDGIRLMERVVQWIRE
ncbi:copper/iron-regulated glutamine amidotransferase [Aspergillus steynii IBT 23096]|uniref:Copper/iron-regulated glutamine amidotransferase n=1 Tax=Aspergillus steynii IBT 23096 TaxID=1392250 RepID=A0A2I2G8B8_9EURO|nr:copper/iron-regulated glutamine amidotransferase [Aspergillus steynii IBT 23096]PLB49126.1 copper/iron-regulated glutamine amidotransferase [Aspergillus steynii IBT 23096]